MVLLAVTAVAFIAGLMALIWPGRKDPVVEEDDLDWLADFEKEE
jgi:hypothetical protein